MTTTMPRTRTPTSFPSRRRFLPLSAVSEYERLRSTSLVGVRVGLLHGRMPLPEKQAVMDAFRNGEVDVLVSTPVIEVGIDVPNATVMMIRSPARFGLAQLHQLRGRVGRGAHRSYCFLVAESEGETFQRLDEVRHRRVANGDDPQEVEQWFRAALAQAESSRERLNVLARTNDGFEIAEADLGMRSHGDFFGTRQSGVAPVRMARPDDRDLLDASQRARRTHPGCRPRAGDPSRPARCRRTTHSGRNGTRWPDGGRARSLALPLSRAHNAAMRVSKMEWRGVRVPLRQPELALDPSKAGRNALLIWMHMDNGLVGVGEAATAGPGRPPRHR